MTPADLQQWQANMGYTDREAADALGGYPLKTYQSWKNGRSWGTGKPINPPPMLGLACAAICAGLSPIGSTDQSTDAQPAQPQQSTQERQPQE